ncbi:MAG TPA: NAD-dependent epimerase/dehydratase family protein [Rhodanobacter sp.]|jgi:nucleoside-diphosphate-sugar epimerase|nr:NAD-dependent epimerase/dehydratase family protein [Rhodanobacter sp.]
MTVLVFGASSQIGHFLLPRLLADGEQVLALSRQPRAPQPDLRWLRGQLPADVPALPAVSAIISFGPLQAFADWLARTPLDHAPRIIATSSMSAESKRESSVPAERELSRQLRAGEAALADACVHQGCAWTVLRPTLVYGAGLDKSLTPIARRALRLRVFPLPVARGLRQPVHADDLAQAVLAALDCPAAAGRVLAIGGGERLTAGAMFARVRSSLPRATLPVPLPAWLLRCGRYVLPRWRGPLTRLDTDLVADNDEMQRLLGIHPRGFAPDAAAWSPVA